MKKKCELLAPAGGMRQLRAAVENGADAVYLGGKLFNARINADNFTNEDISLGVEYAHLRDARIYVTMNTLLRDEELISGMKYAAELYNMGVDALIVQDLGLASLLRRHLPEMPMHLSTQGTVYNSKGVAAAAKLGFKRVVLARELTLEEIRRTAENAPAEIEVFVHGALCICYSGQCQMSRCQGGRSGNRGMCAQPCRLPYKMREGDREKYLLSPKDICTVDFLGELIDGGVTSLKIEGRMKSPEYVAIVTGIYRKYMDEYLAKGEYSVSAEDRESLLQIFNRGGFTEGYLHGNPDEGLMSGELSKHQGIYIGRVAGIPKERNLIDVALETPIVMGDGIEIRSRELTGNVVTYLKPLEETHYLVGDIKGKVKAGDRVFRITDQSLMKRARQTFEKGNGETPVYAKKIKLEATFCAKLGEHPALTLIQKGREDVGTKAEAEDIFSEKAVSKALDAGIIEKQLRKTGGTPFDIEECNIDIGENISVPVSAINSLRRDAMTQLALQKTKVTRKPVDEEELGRLLEKNCENLYMGQNCREQKTELYFYRGAHMLKYPVKGLLSDLAKNGIETGNVDVLIPVMEYLEDQTVYEERLNVQGVRARIIPYIFNVSKGFLDRYLDSNKEKLLAVCAENGVIAGNLGWLWELAEAGIRVYGDYGLNIYNKVAEETVRLLGGIPIALSLEDYEGGHGPIPLMVSEHSFGVPCLTDRKGVCYSVENEILPDKSIILSDHKVNFQELKRQNQAGTVRIYCVP